MENKEVEKIRLCKLMQTDKGPLKFSVAWTLTQ